MKNHPIWNKLIFSTLATSLPLLVITPPANAIALGMLTGSLNFENLSIDADFTIDLWDLFSFDDDLKDNSSGLISLAQILTENYNRQGSSQNWLVNTFSRLRLTRNGEMDATPVILEQTGLDNVGEGLYYFTTDLNAGNNNAKNNAQNRNSERSSPVSIATYQNFLGFQGNSRVQFRDLRLVSTPQNNLVLDVKPLWSGLPQNQRLAGQTYPTTRGGSQAIAPITSSKAVSPQPNISGATSGTTFSADANIEALLERNKISVNSTPNVNFTPNIPLSPEQEKQQKELEKQKEQNEKRVERQRQQMTKQMEQQKRQQEREQEKRAREEEKKRERLLQEAAKRQR
jgi:hypothetical protein